MLSVPLQRKLDKPFTNGQIKQLPGPGGKRLNYVDTASVIDRLNKTFGHDWSFEVVESQTIDKQVLVLGRLTAHGVIKTAYGGHTIGSGPEGAIDAYKSAVGDAIKLCAKQFGIGLHLWM